MWSLGILTYQLLMGYTPYQFTGSLKELEDDIYNGMIHFDKFIPDEGRHFIFNLLQPNPKKRLTLKAAKEHKFLKGAENERLNKWWKCKCN